MFSFLLCSCHINSHLSQLACPFDFLTSLLLQSHSAAMLRQSCLTGNQNYGATLRNLTLDMTLVSKNCLRQMRLRLNIFKIGSIPNILSSLNTLYQKFFSYHVVSHEKIKLLARIPHRVGGNGVRLTWFSFLRPARRNRSAESARQLFQSRLEMNRPAALGEPSFQ